MENNQSPQEQGPIVKPEIKKLSMISYAYFFLSGIIVRILLNSEFLSLTENFERNTIIYISITTLVATLLISIAPHKMANNPVLSGIYSFKNDQFGELKKRISTKYSAMDLTLGNLWGNIILFFTVLLVLISFLISYSTDLGKQSFNLDYLFEKLLGIEQSVSIDNKVLLFDSNLSLTIIILLFIFLIIMFLKIHFGCKEYGRRLNLAILLGYTIEYEYGYAELLEKFLDLTKNDKRECNELYDVNWVSNYEKELGKNWTILNNLYSKQKRKIMELLQKLNDYGATDPKQNTKIEKINYALLLNGIIPIFLRSIKDGENNLDKYKEYIRLQQFHKIEEIIKKIKDEVN